jgi:hypothetical protein
MTAPMGLRWDCDDSPDGIAIQPRWDCDAVYRPQWELAWLIVKRGVWN